jgi:hypothetical protein
MNMPSPAILLFFAGAIETPLGEERVVKGKLFWGDFRE